MQPPIIVIGFNRPAYLDQVLGSLVSQAGCDMSRRLAFFQDGPVSELSGKRYATDADVAETAAVFERHFPGAPIFSSAKNLGICANFDRAERYAFDDLDAEVAYFLEDDLVLTPHYISAMDQIWDAVKDLDRIAYFAAYGDRFASAKAQAQNIRSTMPMRHNWAFGLRRSHWREMRAFLKPYYDIVLAGDYHDRDDASIRQWHQSLGHAHEATSQDGAKTLATSLLGRVRLLTLPCFARYIGAVGTHTNPALFAKEGFAEAEVYQGAFEGIEVPSDSAIDLLIAEEQSFYRSNCEKQRAGTPALVSTRSDIIAAYRLFLGREPESEAVFRARLGQPLADMLDGFARSEEYLRRVGKTKSQPHQTNHEGAL